MSEENNVCEICGGWLRIAYTIEFRKCTPHSISVDPNPAPAPFKLCPGHPEPVEKHDGNLDESTDYHAFVETQENYGLCDGSKLVVVRGGHGDCESSCILLNPEQALSLRDWLIQESPELERLAKEQESVAENEKTISLPPPFLDISKRPDMDWLSTIKIRPTITDVHERTKEQGQ